MFRTTLLLLIATMLTCPLRCSAAEFASRSETGAVANGCGCCTHPASTSSERSSQDPNEGCGCGDCFCNGAVLESEGNVLSSAVSYFTAALSIPSFDRDVQAAALASASDISSHCGIYPSGRAARIAHQSLLI